LRLREGLPPRQIAVSRRVTPRRPVLIYSDASYKAGSEELAVLGICIYDPQNGRPAADGSLQSTSCLQRPETLARWGLSVPNILGN